MMGKERLILESAISLFSKKGFGAASIQDIANHCHIAKGSIYSYFKSKDDLLIAAFHYYFQQVQKQLSAVEQEQCNPREQFVSQLSLLIDSYLQHKEFIDLSNYGDSSTLSDSIKRILYRKKYEIHQFYINGLLSVYGEKIRPYVYDLVIMLEGIFFSYIKVMAIDGQGLKKEGLAHFIMNRVNDLVAGLIETEEQIFSETEMKQIIEKVEVYIDTDQKRIESILSKISKHVISLPYSEQYMVSLEVLKEEFASASPREPVIEGMLSNFKGIPKLEKHLKELKMMLLNK